MTEKEREDYRRILNAAQSEFEEMWRYGQYSFRACKSLFFRIGKTLAMYSKKPGFWDKTKDYYERKGVIEILQHRSEKEHLTAENADLKAALDRVEKLQRHYKRIGFNDTAKAIEQALKGE